MLSNNNISQLQRQANNNNRWFAIQVYLKKFLKLRFFVLLLLTAVLLLLYFKERKIQFCCVFKFPISLFSLDFCWLISCECAYEESVGRCCRFFILRETPVDILLQASRHGAVFLSSPVSVPVPPSPKPSSVLSTKCQIVYKGQECVGTSFLGSVVVIKPERDNIVLGITICRSRCLLTRNYLVDNPRARHSCSTISYRYVKYL